MTGSLDTNVVLRLLLGAVPDQQESGLQLLDQPGVRFHVTDVVFAEAAFVMARAYGMSRPDIRLALTGFCALPQIQADQRLVTAALDLYVDRPSLSFEDSYLAAAAVESGAVPLYTFDGKLAKQAPNTKLLKA